MRNRTTKEDLKRTRERIAKEQEQKEIDAYIANPDKSTASDLIRLKGNLQMLQAEVSRMEKCNSLDTSVGEKPRYEKELDDARECVKETKLAIEQQGNGNETNSYR